MGLGVLCGRVELCQVHMGDGDGEMQDFLGGTNINLHIQSKC